MENNMKKKVLLSYRKAKRELFANNFNRRQLERFEANLDVSIEKICEAVDNRNSTYFKNLIERSPWTVDPKSNVITPEFLEKISKNGSAPTPDAKWRLYKRICEDEELISTAQFRVLGVFPIEVYILDALWIMEIGSILEGWYKENNSFKPYANRIKSTRDGSYNYYAVGNFERYNYGYAEWQHDSVNALADVVAKGSSGVSIATDIRGFFHSIPIDILGSGSFYEYFQLSKKASEFGRKVNSIMNDVLQHWHDQVKYDFKKMECEIPDKGIGIPLGLGTSRVISNAVLYKFDLDIKKGLAPKFYGRYVDDIVVIIENIEIDYNIETIWGWLAHRVEGLEIVKEPGENKAKEKSSAEAYKVVYSSSWGDMEGKADQKNCVFEINTDKTKMLFLTADSGDGMVRSFQKHLSENTSEWRKLGQIPLNYRDVPSELVSIVDAEHTGFNTPGHLTDLSAKRSGFALKMRGFEDLYRNCDIKSWERHREEFYRFAIEYILTPLEIFKYYRYIPRIINLSVNCGDFYYARKMISKIVAALKDLSKYSTLHIAIPDISNQGEKISKSVILKWGSRLLEIIVDQVMCCSLWGLSFSQRKSLISFINEGLGLDDVISDELKLDVQALSRLSVDELCSTYAHLFVADLSNSPFRIVLAPDSGNGLSYSDSREFERSPLFTEIARLLRGDKSVEYSNYMEINNAGLIYLFSQRSQLLKKFWANGNSSKNVEEAGEAVAPESLRSLLFPTRPLTAMQIISWTDYLSDSEWTIETSDCRDTPALKTSEDQLEQLDAWLRGLRGFSLNKALEISGGQDFLFRNGRISVPSYASSKRRINPVVGVSSFYVDSSKFANALDGNPRRSFSDYYFFCRFFDNISSTLPAQARPDYLIMPELSMPGVWFETFAWHLAVHFQTSLISGIEYQRVNGSSEVRNQVWAGLCSNALGFPFPALVRQDKQTASHGERTMLRNHRNLSLVPETVWSTPPLIQHGDFVFSMLVCAEMTNIQYRADLRGMVDALFVVEYNKDINSFNSYVESAALDIHCFVAQSNTRQYGDSRIRGPFKDQWKRDMALVRGSDSELIAVAEIPVSELRKFQSVDFTATPFKPLPVGFKLSSNSPRWPR